MRPSRTLATAAVASALVLGACSSAEPEATDTTEPTPTPTETTESETPTPTPTETATIDPTVVPDQITVEYLDAVMDEFARLEARVYARLAASGGDPEDPEALQRYVAFANAASAKVQLRGFIDAFGVEALADPPRPPNMNVRRILDRQQDCVLFTLRYDPSPMLANGVQYESAQPWFMAIRPVETSNLNPVPWKQRHFRTYDEGQSTPATCDELRGS